MIHRLLRLDKRNTNIIMDPVLQAEAPRPGVKGLQTSLVAIRVLAGAGLRAAPETLSM